MKIPHGIHAQPHEGKPSFKWPMINDCNAQQCNPFLPAGVVPVSFVHDECMQQTGILYLGTCMTTMHNGNSGVVLARRAAKQTYARSLHALGMMLLMMEMNVCTEEHEHAWLTG